MKYEHPTIKVAQPAPGHYIVSGHNPATQAGVHGILEECYITPEVPSEVLAQILIDRGFAKPQLVADKLGAEKEEQAEDDAAAEKRATKKGAKK